MINAVVTRNRELLSRSGSYMRAADGVARGGDPPRHSVFLFAKSVTFLGCFKKTDGGLKNKLTDTP